jgi:hypothetical protein
MKKIFSIAFVGLALALSTTSCTMADSSEVALVVDQIGNDKGIPNVEMASGVIFYFPPTQDVFTYKTNIQHTEWRVEPNKYSEGKNAIELTTLEGAVFDADIALDISLNRPFAAEVFKKYRVDLDLLTDTRLKALITKDLVSHSTKYTVDSLLQYKTNYQMEVTKSLTKVLQHEGFTLSNISVNTLHLPTKYRTAINNKIGVVQETAIIKSKTEQAVQESLRKVAIAQGDFDAAELNAKTKTLMSQPKMLELYKAETDRIWAEKGVSPWGNNNVFGSTAGLFLNK